MATIIPSYIKLVNQLYINHLLLPHNNKSPHRPLIRHAIPLQKLAEIKDHRFCNVKTGLFLRDHIQYLGRQKRLCLFNILRDLEITQEQLLFSRLLLEIPVVFSDQRLFLQSKPKTFSTPQQFFRFRIQLIIIDRLGIIDPPFTSTQMKRRLPVGSVSKS